MILTRIWKDINWGSDRCNLAFLVLLSLGIKGVVVVTAGATNPDCVHYAEAAHKILQGDIAASFALQKSLGYTTTLGLTYLLFNDWVLAGQIISTTFLTLTLIPLYALTRELFDTRSALWSGIAFCLMPTVNELASSVVKDAPFLFFILLALWFGSKSISSQRISCFLLTFCCTVLAASFRFEGVLFLVPYFGWAFYHSLRSPAKRSGIFKGLMAIVSMPAIGMSVVFLLSLVGIAESNLVKKILARYTYEYIGINSLASYNLIYEQLKTAEQSMPTGKLLNNFYQIARGNILIIYIIGIIESLIKTLYPFYAIPAYIGVKSAVFSRDTIQLLFLTVATYLLMAYFFIVERDFLVTRYFMVVVLMLLPFVGGGFERLRIRVGHLRFREAIVAIVVILFVFLPGYETFADNWHKKIEIRLAGEWLKNNRDVLSEKIITTDKRIPFYAGLLSDQYVIFAIGENLNYEDIALKNDCDIMVIDISARENKYSDTYSHYKLVKEFYGDKRIVKIYENKSIVL